jgi:hypothetical protein
MAETMTREKLDELERLHKDATDTSRNWTFYWQANVALDNALKPVSRALIAAARKGLEAEAAIARAETAERERDEARAAMAKADVDGWAAWCREELAERDAAEVPR